MHCFTPWNTDWTLSVDGKATVNTDWKATVFRELWPQNIKECPKDVPSLWEVYSGMQGKTYKSEWQHIWLLPTGYIKLLLDMFHDSSQNKDLISFLGSWWAKLEKFQWPFCLPFGSFWQCFLFILSICVFKTMVVFRILKRAYKSWIWWVRSWDLNCELGAHSRAQRFWYLQVHR